MMANVRAERLLKIPAEPSPELRIPGAAAQMRVVSVAGIRLDPPKSTRLFKGIICDDISEFESHMPSHAVQSLWAMSRSQNLPSATAAIIGAGSLARNRTPTIVCAATPLVALPSPLRGCDAMTSGRRRRQDTAIAH